MGARARGSCGAGVSETLPWLPLLFGGCPEAGLEGSARRTSKLPPHSWRSGVISPPRAVPQQSQVPARSPVHPTACRARSAPSRAEAKDKPRWARGLAGCGAESARTRSAFRFKEPYFWEGTGNCQSAREGAHRRWVMSADHLLDNKEGVLQEKVAAAVAVTAAPRSLRGEGPAGEGRGGNGCCRSSLRPRN